MTTPESTPAAATTTPPAVIAGGPGDPIVPATATATTPAPTTTSKEPVRIGSKVFASIEEASAYAEQLESKMLEQSLNPVAPAPTQQTIPTKPKKMINGRPIDEVLFEDPEKVVDFIVDESKRANVELAQKEATRKALWDKFFTKNPDLRGKQVLLDAVLNKNIKDWSKLSEEDGMTMLAKSTRSEIKSMGLEPGSVTDLPRAEVAAATARGEPGTTTQVTTAAPPPNLVDQMKTMQAARKKAK